MRSAWNFLAISVSSWGREGPSTKREGLSSQQLRGTPASSRAAWVAAAQASFCALNHFLYFPPSLLREVVVHGWNTVEMTRTWVVAVRESHAAQSRASVPEEEGLQEMRIRRGLSAEPLFKAGRCPSEESVAIRGELVRDYGFRFLNYHVKAKKNEITAGKTSAVRRSLWGDRHQRAWR